MREMFTGNFTQQLPISEAGIAAAVAVMRHGRLHRYNTTPQDPATWRCLSARSPIGLGCPIAWRPRPAGRR